MADKNGLSARLWLALLKQGGRYSTREAAQLVPDADPLSTHYLLNALSVNGKVRKFPKVKGERIQFGVTAGCSIPNGVTLADILDCELHQVENSR